MDMKKKLLACMSLIALAGSSLVFAANRPGSVSFRLADGYIFFANKRQLENTSIPTIELGYNFNEKWGVQAGASVINTDIKGNGPKSGAHGFYYLLDGVYHFNRYSNVIPYALGGVGITSLKVHNTNDPTDEANVNLGVGAEFFIHDSIALNADVRDVYTMSGGKNDVMVTAGVTFLFGGNNPQPQPYKM
jgi:OOP family OmpA-OmpF porin